MKKILLQVPSPFFANNHIFEKQGTANNTLDSWYRLKNKLLDLGYELTTADDNNLDNCAGIIFYEANSLDKKPKISSRLINLLRTIFRKKPLKSYPSRKMYQEAVEAGLKDKIVLLIWEGPSVCPENFHKETWDKFDHIIIWDDNLVKKDKRFIHYCMPMESHQTLPATIPFNQKKLLVNISYNKFSYDKNELYSARRKSIEYFSKHFPDDFDLYGIRWDQPVTRIQRLFPFTVKKYPTYRGKAMDKLGTLSQYKFNLCYENNSGTIGRITEKIFNAIKAGTVPIYWGSENIQDYIDKNVFVDRREFDNDERLAKFIVNMKELEYEKYIQAGARYISSPKYKMFLPDSFCNRMVEILKEIKIIS